MATKVRALLVTKDGEMLGRVRSRQFLGLGSVVTDPWDHREWKVVGVGMEWDWLVVHVVSVEDEWNRTTLQTLS